MNAARRIQDPSGRRDFRRRLYGERWLPDFRDDGVGHSLHHTGKRFGLQESEALGRVPASQVATEPLLHQNDSARLRRWFPTKGQR